MTLGSSTAAQAFARLDDLRPIEMLTIAGRLTADDFAALACAGLSRVYRFNFRERQGDDAMAG